jgi:hypothetical protein
LLPNLAMLQKNVDPMHALAFVKLRLDVTAYSDLRLVEEVSPRELAVRFTDTERYFVSEASVYRLLKARDLITSPAFIVMKAAEEFKDKTTAPNQLWQTDFTYFYCVMNFCAVTVLRLQSCSTDIVAGS